jgi:hypothetical protein
MPSVARVNPSQTSTEKRITTPKNAIVKLDNIKSITKNIFIILQPLFLVQHFHHQLNTSRIIQGSFL